MALVVALTGAALLVFHLMGGGLSGGAWGGVLIALAAGLGEVSGRRGRCRREP